MTDNNLPTWLRFETGRPGTRGPWYIWLQGAWLSAKQIVERYEISESTIRKRVYRILINPTYPITPEELVSKNKVIIPGPGQRPKIAKQFTVTADGIAGPVTEARASKATASPINIAELLCRRKL